jgi:hypothetical protein
MTCSRSFRCSATSLLRITARVVTAALIMAAISAALRAGPVSSASQARIQSQARVQARTVAFTSPARVKLHVAAPAHSKVSPRPFQLVAATAVAPGSRFSKANAVGEALIVFAVLVMVVVFVRRRRSRARARRRARYARAPAAADDRDNYYAATGINTRGGLDPWTNDPSFPGGPDPRWTNDHPSFPGGPDPRWTNDHPSFPGGPDPRWTNGQSLGMRAIGSSDWPQQEPHAAPHHDPREQAAPPSGWRPQGGRTAATWGSPAGPMTDGFDRAPSWSPPHAGPAGPASQASQARNDDIYGQLPVIVPDGPLRRQAATDLQARPEYLPPYAEADAAELADPVRRQVGDLWSADSVHLAQQILAEADDQAAATIASAEEQAADMRRQASDQAAATLASAEEQAAELRAAVGRMSAQLGAVAAYVTENLASSTIPAALPWPPAPRELLGPAHPDSPAHPYSPAQPESAAQPGTRPAVWPPAEPAARPVTRPDTKTAARRAAPTSTNHAARPAARPKGRPDSKPKGRQAGAGRQMMIALVVLLLVGITAGSAEVALHGLRFFVFRANGAGASVTGPKEAQGPGQPGAPGAQHQANSSKPSAKPGSRPSAKPSTKPR